jgi:hypothetical protein
MILYASQSLWQNNTEGKRERAGGVSEWELNENKKNVK